MSSAMDLDQILKDLKATISGNSALANSLPDLIKAETDYTKARTKVRTDLMTIRADIIKNQAKQIVDLKKSIREAQHRERLSDHVYPPQKRRHMSAEAYEWAVKIEDMANFLYDFRPYIEPGSNLTEDRAAGDMLFYTFFHSHSRYWQKTNRENAEAIKTGKTRWLCFQDLVESGPQDSEVPPDGRCLHEDQEEYESIQIRYDGKRIRCRLSSSDTETNVQTDPTNVQTDPATIQANEIKAQAKQIEYLQRTLREARNDEQLMVHGYPPKKRMRLSDEADKWTVAVEDLADFLYEFRPVIETGSCLDVDAHDLTSRTRTKQKRENVRSMKGAGPDCWFCLDCLVSYGADDAKTERGVCSEHDSYVCVEVRYDGRHLICRWGYEAPDFSE